MRIQGTHTTERYDQNDVEYVVEVDFIAETFDGDYEFPSYEDIDIKSVRVVSIDGQVYSSNQPLPEFIHNDKTLIDDLELEDHA